MDWDWSSAIVGVAVGIAVSFGADWFWLRWGESPRTAARRRSDHTLAKWERKWEKARAVKDRRAA